MRLLWISLLLLALCLSVRSEAVEEETEERLVNGEGAGSDEFLRFNFAIRLAFLYRYTSPLTQKTSTVIMTQCLGILYDANTVITVAHCAQYTSLIPRAICGVEVQQLRNVASVTLHPSFNDTSSGFLANDVAVIKLDGDFNLTSECNVAQLPASAQDHDFQKLTVFGFNTTGAPFLWFLQAFVTIDQLVAPGCFCGQYFQSSFNSSMHVCLIDEQRPRTQMACMNDHGSAAMLDDGTVLGIGSWASSACKSGIPNYPSVYVRLANYVDWFATFKS